ncbi:hypothetical protein QAD02_011114 [Eretmocerus hayati]|uniref:Uncharacterized protein n=1 Tax=Eretmocerus hayati TaxID=131215 RepID=A0ACC2NWT6_9HYME|nr:hypothetical protein QAD02_011114 [Eretmocerus hayati]
MKTLIFLVIVLALLTIARGRITLIGSYSDDFSDVDFPDERDDCSDGSCSVYAEKRMIVPDKVVEHRQIVPRFASSLEPMSPESFPEWKPVCGCGTTHHIVDLGENHFPRYISIARCKPKTCMDNGRQCMHLTYRIHVLVKRGVSTRLTSPDDTVQNVEELTLPQSLHTNWQMYAFTVPVACFAVERT